jgi:hypothetical protein
MGYICNWCSWCGGWVEEPRLADRQTEEGDRGKVNQKSWRAEWCWVVDCAGSSCGGNRAPLAARINQPSNECNAEQQRAKCNKRKVHRNSEEEDGEPNTDADWEE